MLRFPMPGGGDAWIMPADVERVTDGEAEGTAVLHLASGEAVTVTGERHAHEDRLAKLRRDDSDQAPPIADEDRGEDDGA